MAIHDSICEMRANDTNNQLTLFNSPSITRFCSKEIHSGLIGKVVVMVNNENS